MVAVICHSAISCCRGNEYGCDRGHGHPIISFDVVMIVIMSVLVIMIVIVVIL